MKVMEKNSVHVTFDGEDGAELLVSYDNRGEPYREGISLTLNETNKPHRSYVFLEGYEARQLRDLIDRLYPRRT